MYSGFVFHRLIYSNCIFPLVSFIFAATLLGFLLLRKMVTQFASFPSFFWVFATNKLAFPTGPIWSAYCAFALSEVMTAVHADMTKPWHLQRRKKKKNRPGITHSVCACSGSPCSEQWCLVHFLCYHLWRDRKCASCAKYSVTQFYSGISGIITVSCF